MRHTDSGKCEVLAENSKLEMYSGDFLLWPPPGCGELESLAESSTELDMAVASSGACALHHGHTCEAQGARQLEVVDNMGLKRAQCPEQFRYLAETHILIIC